LPVGRRLSWPRWDFTWEIVRFPDRADIMATVIDGQPELIDGRPRFDSAVFRDATETEGVRSVNEAALIKSHPTADSSWPK
jgi:hypothetical protein